MKQRRVHGIGDTVTAQKEGMGEVGHAVRTIRMCICSYGSHGVDMEGHNEVHIQL
jgi:hypothetical protein